MSSPNAELLARCVGRILEEAAFVFTEPAEVAPPPFSGPVLEARLDFSGKDNGSIQVFTDETMAAELAANLLGEEPGDPSVATRGREALGELVNIIAGSLVVDLFGDQSACRLGVPEIRSSTDAEHSQVLEKAVCSVTLITEEGRRLDAILQTSGTGV